MPFPKPPKLFHLSRSSEPTPPPETPSETEVQKQEPVIETPVQTETETKESSSFVPEIETPAPDETDTLVSPEEPTETIPVETEQTDDNPTPPSFLTQEQPEQDALMDELRYSRPPVSEPEDTSYVSEPDTVPEEETQLLSEEEDNAYPLEDIIPAGDTSAEEQQNEPNIEKLLGPNQKVIRAPSVSSIPFSDIWYTPEKIAYIRDEETRFALVPFEAGDLKKFYKALEQGYTGASSYAIRFMGESYRVERIMTLGGVQYNCRKMPTKVPDIYSLGLPKHTVDYLLTLSKEAGLILFGGPTGMGKTTSASALMKKFLEMDGGFMYTIEDPPEMPLEGLYHAEHGGLGLCKQCPVDNERWGEGIKSALRSRPRYILVGEIRTPETASQVLRAATSGHLVLSTIHASTVEDALESLIKYASGAGLTESLAADLLARGILGVVHQKLEGSTTLRPVLTSCFANPHLSGGDQMRSLVRSQTINLQTLIEAQSSRMFQGRPLFDSDERKGKKEI